LTLKAQQRLQEADVLVIDRLVGPGVLEYARRDAVRIDVGKTAGGPSASQDEINRILVREALKGHRVARLKGGDAFVFGRAAEEIAAVRAAGISVDIVPGITAAHACAASIGLPLTLREQIRQFTLVTGGTAKDDPDLDWRALAQSNQAFAVYMGLRTAGEIAAKLMAAGADGHRPVVVVENGTRTNERVIGTTLDRLAEAITALGVKGPAIVFVGLDWSQAHLTPPRRLEVFPAAREDAAETSRGWTAQDIALNTHWVAG
jgi:uroporphyrin-III C-methyltransferase/precorrin-2 dehydrogenase/sirohydrochlorin ferrochelatase